MSLHFNSAFGSSRITNPAYPSWLTSLPQEQKERNILWDELNQIEKKLEDVLLIQKFYGQKKEYYGDMVKNTNLKNKIRAKKLQIPDSNQSIQEKLIKGKQYLQNIEKQIQEQNALRDKERKSFEKKWKDLFKSKKTKDAQNSRQRKYTNALKDLNDKIGTLVPKLQKIKKNPSPRRSSPQKSQKEFPSWLK